MRAFAPAHEVLLATTGIAGGVWSEGFLILLCQWFEVVVEIIGFFKDDSFLKNRVISIRYSSL
jgi:hypothetical protein